MSIYAASVDDNDSQVIYSGSGWELVTQDGQWRGTMHSTSTTGSWARFRFTGSRIAVICTIPTGDGSLSQATFKLDDADAQYVSHRTTPPVQWQTTFWDSGPLPMGSHLLTITNAGNDAYFRMDRIDYDPTDSNAPRTTPTPPTQNTVTVQVPPPDDSTTASGSSTRTLTTTTSGATRTDATGNVAPTGSNTLTAPNAPVASNSTNTAGGPGATGSLDGSKTDVSASSTSGPPLAGILAGLFGGLFLLLVVAVLVYCLRRRKRKQRARAESALPFPPTAEYERTFAPSGPSTYAPSVSGGSLAPLREKTTPPGGIHSAYVGGNSSRASGSMYTDPPSTHSDTSGEPPTQEPLHPKIQAIMREDGQSGSRLIAHNQAEVPRPNDTQDPYHDFPPPPAYSTGPGASTV